VRKRIVEKLNRSGVQARLSQGPIETLDLVRGRADEDQWREILNSYAQVVYGSSHQDPSRELKDILLKLKELR
jgi:hypothetical protein